MQTVSRSGLVALVFRYHARNAAYSSVQKHSVASAGNVLTGHFDTFSTPRRPFSIPGIVTTQLEGSLHGRFNFLDGSQVRSYAKKKSGAKAAEKEDLEDQDEAVVLEEEDDSGEVKDWKEVKVSVSAARLDNIMKSALGVSRNKIEEGFLENRIRVNGEKVSKKSGAIALGDELDYIAGVSAENPDFLDIQRVQVHELGDTTLKAKLTIKARVWKKLLVPNYKGKDKYSISSA